jgi:hypothetical protein
LVTRAASVAQPTSTVSGQPLQQEAPPKGWISSNWKAIFLLGTVIMGTISLIGFAEFMYEEASQQAGFGTFQCANALKMAESNEEISSILKVCMAQIETAKQVGGQGKRFTNSFGWINPLNWNSYVVYFKGFESNINTNEQLIRFMADKYDKKLSANATVYTKDVYTYESKVISFKESDIKGMNTALDQLSKDGWAIKSSYTTKIGGVWAVVFIMQRTIVTQVPA